MPKAKESDKVFVKSVDLWEKYKSRKLRVVAFPVTPTPIHNRLVYKPDCFMSRVFDHQALDNSEIVGSAPTRNGPAFLSYLALDDIMSQERCFGTYGNRFLVNNGAYCAKTSYFEKGEFYVTSEGYARPRVTNKITHASEADVHKLNLIGSSCNAGSHFIIPDAPFMTALVHLEQGMKLDNGLDYFTAKECRDLFPSVNFSKNAVVDKFVKSILFESVEGENINVESSDEYFDAHVSGAHCLDPYDRQCLRELGRNFLLEEEEWLQKLELL